MCKDPVVGRMQWEQPEQHEVQEKMAAWPYQATEKHRDRPSEDSRETKITHRSCDSISEREVWLLGSGEQGGIHRTLEGSTCMAYSLGHLDNDDRAEAFISSFPIVCKSLASSGGPSKRTSLCESKAVPGAKEEALPLPQSVLCLALLRLFWKNSRG